MKITIESTTKIVEVDGVPARVWEGQSEAGIPVVAIITRIAIPDDADPIEFARDLESRRPPSPAADMFPSRMVL